MGLFTTSATGFLKDTYLPGYINQYENAPGTLFGTFYKGSKPMEIEGANAFLKIRIGDSLGQGTIAENGDYPTAGDVTTAQATVTAAHLAHSINLSSEEAAYIDSGSAAAEPVISMKMDAAMDAMSRDIERQSWMDGTGIIANIASTATTTATLDATTTAQIDRDRYIWLDDTNRASYDIVNGTTGAQQVTAFTVSNIAYPATEVITSPSSLAAGTAAGVLVRSGNWANAGAFRSLEFRGLQAMIDNANTYLGINRATAGNGYWQAVIDSNAGVLRPITENLIMGFTSKMARRRTDGKQPRGSDYMGFANSGSWAAYHNLLLPAQRYTNATPELGWGEPLTMRGILLYEDIHCPRNGIMVVHKPSVEYVKAKHASNVSGDLLKFKENNGNMFFQGNAAVGRGHSAQVFAYLEGFLGMMTKRPRNHGWLRDITEVASAY